MSSHQFSGTCDNSLEDNEENLEENAAMMLSFRFDPSCTGYSSNRNCPDSPVAVPLGRHDASPVHNLQSKSDVASGDTDVRVLRPRDQCRRKGHIRKRRHFYEVLVKDMDPFWMVQKKIKVYWPLDQIWYFGKVIGYDPKKLLHHIKYDDREEEWIDLQKERFKLLLFPSELPSKARRRRSRAGVRYHVKGESNTVVQDDYYPISTHMDSKPIISWLAKSTGRIKSSSSGGTSKKSEASNQTENSLPSALTAAKGTISNSSADKLLSDPALLDNSYGGVASPMARCSRFPMVYFRRRFKMKEQGKGDVSDDKLGPSAEEQLVCSRVGSPVKVDNLGVSPQEHVVNCTISDSVDSLVVRPERSHSTEICDSSAGHLVSLEVRQYAECNHDSCLDLCRTNLGDKSRKNFPSVGCEDVEMLQKPSQQSQVLVDKCLNEDGGIKMKSEQCVSTAQPSCPIDDGSALEGRKTTYDSLNGITVEIPLSDAQERPSDDGVHSGHASVLASNTVSKGSWNPGKVSSSLLGNPSLSDGKLDLLCSGPKKPRTQVSYFLLPEGHDITTKSRTHHMKGFSHKRIRRASDKRESDGSRKYRRNMESVSCDVNVLVCQEDRGWREEGARVVLEPVDDNEWQLVVKISGSTRYAYKVNQFLQSGTTNRYTYAMMWREPKDWSLEFPDRSQWTLFKEMHEECYNRNFRAASVKNIPIPGVRLVEENDDHEVELPFVRPSTRYFRQLQTDVDIALDPSHVIYDMDSDDELWISERRSSGLENCGFWDVSEEMFEKLMDILEKFAYTKQQDHFTSDELEHLVVEFGPLEAIKTIYEHWLEKRRKKGMPLVRHLRPPHWEIYKQQVKKWESTMTKNNGTVSTGWHEKAIEKPPMFPFCLKPRGLELPNNRGMKHRSQKKLDVAGNGNVIPGYYEAFHSCGKRFYSCVSGEEKIMYQHGSFDSSPWLRASTRLLSSRDIASPGYFTLNDDGYERTHYPRPYKTKSRRIGALLYPNDLQEFSSHNQRSLSKRIGRQASNTYIPRWPSPRYCHSEQLPRISAEHLDPTDLDEFRLRDASCAAKHAVIMAKMKREHAQRLLYKADLAIHKAAVALMTVDAIKASRG